MIDLKVKTKQETGSYCGPAVIEMVVKYLGHDVKQVEVVEACEAKNTVMKDGISLEDLAKGVKKLFPDLSVWQKQDANLEDLKKVIEAGFPVVVDWQGIFTADEYGDEIWNSKNRIVAWWRKIQKTPEATGDQGHYCVVVDVDLNKGFIKFVDPYGHYAGKERFVAAWEFEERWWDDRIGQGETGKKELILENRLMFVVVPKDNSFFEALGMVRV